ncbi:restriction endonuclease PLD domain-containing protein [Bacillus gaemokensis]|uniref:PLD phosphodiesterase domain-containing protein n=1 Tax=Bacillus gaemokensis TaxID=574375 RepID=A0A073KCX0_9BACI|nr:restriction endonuclease PLD domain-containing protein [Bacillus gaemokensis]KEK24410.1 hypothetical protein BAGA_27095 [Bacillus gaemokensis]KYG38385.1 hypothetical protein AZF08_18825 [Bacillus gaemokensis]
MLHGKIYIAESKGNPSKAIITSANFTDSGLKNKHEWGVMLEDTVQLSKIIEDVNNNSIQLMYEEIEQIIKKIDNYISENERVDTPKIDLGISGIYMKRKRFPPSLTTDLKQNVRYFIKPVGWSDRPFDINRRLSTDIEELHFAKRPAAIGIGDIIICYGVGTTKLIGYFEAVEEAINLNNESRWPWVIKAKNLCPDYSEHWNTYDNTISSVQKSYPQGYAVTFNGHPNLGGLQYGGDKIRLDVNFAKHMIGIIENK